MSGHKSTLKPVTFMAANVISLQLYCERSEAIQETKATGLLRFARDDGLFAFLCINMLNETDIMPPTPAPKGMKTPY